ncbi:MarR family transcriptional regulator [Microbacterium sp. ARD31]|uniref:MarR family winged helix-turn-helix transcriptional regulator n=1 Tax=Microbacterium sp. ARD31 TaxID=2962576 RepID=UPI002881084B|nr:MarR family transcriptional regulator [Microbacterium sp. ARD31]MDT0180347.1 MarR family transcriptional regulator [Microbacterium sp. ARD31]
MPEPLLLDRLLLVSELFQRDMARAFAGTPLSPARMAVLWTLHHDGPSTQQALASALGVSPRNITGLVDALEESGHVNRVSHPTDRRAHLVELTEAGTQLMRTTAREHAHLSAALSEAVDAADRETLDRALDAVTARLRQLIEEQREEVPHDPHR